MKVKPKPKTRLEPLADGQVWQMADSSLRVDLVGNLLVHYKLGKHNAVRVSNSIGTKTNIEHFLKKNKAVLLKGAKAAAAKLPAAVKKNEAANK
jgi:hypothetical protein